VREFPLRTLSILLVLIIFRALFRVLLLIIVSYQDVEFSDIKELCEFYESDLTNPGVVEQEFNGWKWKWQSSEEEHIPQNCADTESVQ